MDERIIALYKAANEVCAQVGANGDITADSKEIEGLMGVLHDIDQGTYNPKWNGEFVEPECEHRMMKYKGEPAKCMLCGHTQGE